MSMRRVVSGFFLVLASLVVVSNGPSAYSAPYTKEFAPWEVLGPEQIGSSPAAVAQTAGTLDLFARAVDGQLIHKSYSPAGWSGWDSQGGVLQSAPAAASWAPGRIDVFVVGTDGQVWHKWSDGGTWAYWEPLGGAVLPGTAPTVTSWGPGRLDLLVVGTDLIVYHKFYDASLGTTWSPWEMFPVSYARVTGPITAASTQPGTIYIWDVAAARGWLYRGGGYIPIDMPADGAPASAAAIASWSPERLDFVVRGDDASVWHKAWYGSGWTPLWDLMGGQIVGQPAMTTWGPWRLDIFVQGTDGRLWHTWGQPWP